MERKEVFGITFEQGRNELKIDEEFFANVVTENKDIPESAKMDLAISMITLKYTQSNSVCYVKDGQAIGIGAGQAIPDSLYKTGRTKSRQLVAASVPQGTGTAV